MSVAAKIALQLVSVKEPLKADFYNTLMKVKFFGYHGVEFAGLHGNDPMEVKKMCEDAGLEPVSAHVPFRLLRSDMEQVLEDYKKIGCKYIVIPCLDDEYKIAGGNLKLEIISAIKEIGVTVREYDMVLQYHNHFWEMAKIDGEVGLDRMYEEIAPELLQTQLDTCWVKAGGKDPAAYVRKYSGRIPTVHLKDYWREASLEADVLTELMVYRTQAQQGKFEFRPLGMGLQNIEAIVNAALEGGAQWLIVEQDKPSAGMTDLECVAHSAEKLLDVLGARL